METDEQTPEAVLLPDVLRFPSDLAGRFGGGCMLDAEGVRVCWGSIAQTARLREEQCGEPPAPDAAIILQQHDDGPWERLVQANDLCGIRGNGSLHCFVDHASKTPTWAEFDWSNKSYEVPIEGHVDGVVARYNGAVAWTRDGTIYAYDRDEPPSQVGTLEGLDGLTVGIGGAIFAWLEDGHVMAWDSKPTWYDQSGPPIEEWREVEELSGAKVYADSSHGCALFPDGRVLCFGDETGFRVDGERFRDLGPTEVRALRGARTLHLEQNRVCGLMPRSRLRCVGKEAARGAGTEPRGGVAERNLRKTLGRAVEPSP